MFFVLPFSFDSHAIIVHVWLGAFNNKSINLFNNIRIAAGYSETSVQHLLGQSTHQDRHRRKVIVEAYQSNLYFYSKYYSRGWNIILRFLYKAVFLAGLVTSGLRHLRGTANADDSLSLKVRLLLMSRRKVRVKGAN